MTKKNSFFKAAFSKLNSDKHLTRLFVIFAILFVGLTLINSDRFLTIDNFQSMMYQFPEYGMMALGIMLTMIIGGIDLSVVGVANLTSIVVASILLNMAPKGSPEGLTTIVIIFAIFVAVAVGVVSGLINGLLVSKIGIPPILATLGSYQFFTGVAIIITKGAALSRLPITYSNAIRTTVLGVIPLSFVIFLAAVLVLSYVLNRTKYGTEIYMMGSNPTASRFSGLKNDRLTIRTHIYSSVLAAIGGLIMLANYNSAKADYGSAYTLQCVLIVVLGGVNPIGGFGKVSGVTMAIFTLQILSSGLNMFPQISNFYRPLIWGAVLLIVMLTNYLLEERESRQISRSMKTASNGNSD